jgi:hypothetical protein
MRRPRSPLLPSTFRRCLLLLVVVLFPIACSDRHSLVEPAADDGLISATLTCTLDVKADTLSCRPAGASAWGQPQHGGLQFSVAGDLIVGGQNQYITLATDSVRTALNTGTMTFFTSAWVTVQNLIVQALGSADGETKHVDGVRVFYHRAPWASAGSGAVTILAADGTGTFTAENQPFYHYDQMVLPGATSLNRLWRWSYPTTVTEIRFEVFVVGRVRHSQGWIEVSPAIAQIPVGDTRQLSAVAYTAVAQDPAATLSWQSSHPDVATVSSSGLVTAISDGFAEITVTSGSRTGTADITIGDPNLVLTSIAPTVLIHGQSAVITGAGFNPVSLGQNVVAIGGLPAAVLSATATTLEVQIPSPCLPLRDVVVEVSVGTQSDELNAQARPGSFLNMPVGQQMIIENPADFCLHFDATAASESYLLGVQRISATATELTPVTLTSVLALNAVAAQPLITPGPPVTHTLSPGQPQAPQDTPDWLSEKVRIREQHQAMLSGRMTLLSPSTIDIAAAVAGDVTVGTMVQMKLPFGRGGCGSTATLTEVTAEVRANGARAIWLEDVDNPVKITQAHVDQLSAQFDAYSYPTNVEWFGQPTDIDGNGKVLIFITHELAFALGFVTSADWAAQVAWPNGCINSNEAEVMYLRPGTSSANMLRDWPVIVAHEMAHIIQISRQITLTTPSMSAWEAEGQARVAEEVVGHAVTGRSTGQNYGSAVAYENYPFGGPWYSGSFVDVWRYFGSDQNGNQVAGAPEQCTFLSTTGTCQVTGAVYGRPWILLRWVLDQFGPGYPGGEAALSRAMTDSPVRGFAALQNLTGTPIETILAQWAATLYVDGRIPSPANRLTMSSWNLFSTFEQHAFVTPGRRLVPYEKSFADFVDNVSVRSASSAYFRVSGEGRGQTSIRVRDALDGTLPAAMQIWIVRLQ